MPIKLQPDSETAAHEKAIYEQEQHLTGPPLTGKGCADSDCAKAKQCRKTFFIAGTCRLKYEYIRDVVKVIDAFIATPRLNLSLLASHDLQTIPAGDILLDLFVAHLDIRAKAFPDQLALVYFLGRASGEYSRELLKEIMDKPIPFVTKAAELRTLSDSTPAAPIYLTRRNVLIAGVLVAAAVAGGVAGGVMWQQGAFDPYPELVGMLPQSTRLSLSVRMANKYARAVYAYNKTVAQGAEGTAELIKKALIKRMERTAPGFTLTGLSEEDAISKLLLSDVETIGGGIMLNWRKVKK